MQGNINNHHENHGYRYAVYYGKNRFNDLKNFDFVIVEPSYYTAGQIRLLVESGVRSFAYLSFFETLVDSDESKLFSNSRLKVGGKEIVNTHYQNPYMDLSCTSWQNYLYHQIETYIRHKGFQGIFMDTLGNMEDPRLNDNLMYQQIRSFCDILDKIKSKYPGILLMQNNGLEILLDYTKNYIDAVCWENPQPGDAYKGINKHIIEKLRQIRKNQSLEVLLLSDGESDEAWIRQLAFKQHYSLCITGKDYLDLDTSG
jgi:polysaccharide biosynthesis protein PelA